MTKDEKACSILDAMELTELEEKLRQQSVRMALEILSRDGMTWTRAVHALRNRASLMRTTAMRLYRAADLLEQL